MWVRVSGRLECWSYWWAWRRVVMLSQSHRHRYRLAHWLSGMAPSSTAWAPSRLQVGSLSFRESESRRWDQRRITTSRRMPGSSTPRTGRSCRGLSTPTCISPVHPGPAVVSCSKASPACATWVRRWAICPSSSRDRLTVNRWLAVSPLGRCSRCRAASTPTLANRPMLSKYRHPKRRARRLRLKPPLRNFGDPALTQQMPGFCLNSEASAKAPPPSLGGSRFLLY